MRQDSQNIIVVGEGIEVRLRGTCIVGWMNIENFIHPCQDIMTVLKKYRP